MNLRAEDCLVVGFCTRGQMRFCRQHNLDFRHFVDHGLPVEVFAEIDDANLDRAIAQATKRERESA